MPSISNGFSMYRCTTRACVRGTVLGFRVRKMPWPHAALSGLTMNVLGRSCLLHMYEKISSSSGRMKVSGKKP
eukprot:CAMPEP_0117617178 /NCGR_PEP_ID=MMETSP0784-20121206/85462_1 /TAXON_ID=39447 /ORGANISM="" /LENGTH=72 /DNA_ID=CAMNT_0005421019 /DNA_START=529 /DNA_END=747 /DNA_ORIENTATION=-